MTLSVYLWGIRLFTLIAFCAWLGIVFAVDPDMTGMAGLSLFFISLFATILGFLVFGITWVYRRALGETSAAYHLGSSFRQALLLTLYGTLIIFFQYQRILTWWDALLLLAGVLLIEFSYRKIFQKHNEE